MQLYIIAVRERIFQNEAKIASITKCALILFIKMLNGKKCLSKTFVSVQISFSNRFLQVSEGIISKRLVLVIILEIEVFQNLKWYKMSIIKMFFLKVHSRMEPNSIRQLTEMNHSNSKLVQDKLSRDGKKVSWACALVKRGDSSFPQNSVMEIR